MKLNKKMFLFLIPLLLALFILSGCGIIPQPPEGKISGRVLIPSSEISKDITGWVPIANAVVTVVDADGVTHTVTTDENGYYAFEGIAVNPNTIITATVGQNGDILVLKDVINQAVAADEDYDAGDMDPESTALALVLEALIAEGIDLSDIDLEEIRASDSFSALVNLVTTVLEEGGDVTKDPDIADLIEDIINPPVPPSPTPPSPNPTPKLPVYNQTQKKLL
ncbi:MAG: carboxypeptidase-like regulatory domain-containing protein [Atribacterota bacterium]|nr:carboxypeptidase-like regulatory domain-containing protein [Atribacterota bacterium]